MERPFPGVTATILDDNCEKELPPGKEGHLALKAGWPSMFRTYWNRQELYDSRFRNGWYITGDRATMEVVKAFVSLKDGYEPSDELKRDIKKFARKKLHAVACPRKIDFLPGLPKTKSGKIMRRLLKARELGLPEGDTSTLEE